MRRNYASRTNGSRGAAAASLPEIVDEYGSVEMAPYLQRDFATFSDADSLFEVTALLNDRNATVACVNQAGYYNYTADKLTNNTHPTTRSAALDVACARLFSVAADLVVQNITNTTNTTATLEAESLYS